MRRLFFILLISLLITSCITGCSGGESESASTSIQSGSSYSPQAGSSDNMAASDGASSEEPIIKPEQLISKEEAVTLVGESVKTGVTDTYPLLGLESCFYAVENSESNGYLQICVIQKGALSGGEGGSESSSQPSQSQSSQSSESQGGTSSSDQQELLPKTIYEGLKKLFSDPNTTVTGRIGDDTFISAQGISIISGEYCIIILTGGTDTTKTQDVLKQAGELAIVNLQRIKGE